MPNVGCGETLTWRRRLGGPLGLADRLERGLAGLPVEPVDEQDPVEVVGLVLHAAGQQVAALDGHRLAVHVLALGHHPQGPPGVEVEAREGQAALLALLLLVGEVEAAG